MGLLPDDRLSVVTYDSHVQTLIPAVELRDKETMRLLFRDHPLYQPGWRAACHPTEVTDTLGPPCFGVRCGRRG